MIDCLLVGRCSCFILIVGCNFDVDCDVVSVNNINNSNDNDSDFDFEFQVLRSLSIDWVSVLACDVYELAVLQVWLKLH